MTLPELTDSRLDIEEGIAILTLERDDVKNALTGTALVEDILNTLDWCNIARETSILVLTGDGSAFSAGGNIKHMRDRQGMFSGSVLQIQEQYRRGIQKLPLAFEKCEIPVIAAVNGPAIGAGFDLACMCDLRLAGPDARVGETFINLGIIPGDGGAWFLQRLVGYQRAAELTLTGRILEAREAQQLGLFLEVVESDQLLHRARELAAVIASKPPHAVRLTKRLLKSAQRGSLGDFLDLCACFQGMCHHTGDHLEAVSAFLEKRPPTFRGDENG